MFRIDSSTAAAALLAPGDPGTPGFFTKGNPETGVPATTISDDWLNMIQEEFMSILAAGGIDESKTAFNQVLTALQALFKISLTFDASAQTLVLTVPGGFVLQLGTGTQAAAGGAQVVNLPVQLASAPFWSMATNAAGTTPTAFHGTQNTSKSAITVYSAVVAGTPAPAGVSFFWASAGFK